MARTGNLLTLRPYSPDPVVQEGGGGNEAAKQKDFNPFPANTTAGIHKIWKWKGALRHNTVCLPGFSQNSRATWLRSLHAGCREAKDTAWDSAATKSQKLVLVHCENLYCLSD